MLTQATTATFSARDFRKFFENSDAPRMVDLEDSAHLRQAVPPDIKKRHGVFCPLPPLVIEALEKINAKGEYFFWSGRSKPKSAVGDYQRALQRLFELAETPRVHAHLLRHRFATQLLEDGTTLETVATLLGHSNTKVTSKSYSHWVKGRQEKLEEAVKNSWTQLTQLPGRHLQITNKTKGK